MEEVELLLTVIEKCVGHHPKLGGISSEAMTRLLEINEECRQKGLKRTAVEAEKVAEAQAQVAEEADKADKAEKAVEDPSPRTIRRSQSSGDPSPRRV